MTYKDRPGASPVVAALFAVGEIGTSDRVLDVGCGGGTDCIALRSWGVRQVVGIDVEASEVARADNRARQFGVYSEELFHVGSITERHPCFDRGQFTVVIDSLALNNVAQRPRALPAYAAEVARVLEPGGLLVLQVRQDRGFNSVGDVEDLLPPSFRDWFSFGRVVTTHLAENPPRRGAAGHATIALVTGTRRTRRLRNAR